MAYIHLEEATQFADAASARSIQAEDALSGWSTGWAAGTTKTREQLERRIGQIIGVKITGLIDVTVNTATGS